MRRWVVVRALVLIALAVLVACDPGIDHRGDPGVPAPRTDASSAFDSANGTIVMFGGATRSGVLDETWTWDGAGWRRQHPATTPPARELAFMSYDPATSRVVMFGGMTCGAPEPTVPTGCDYQESAIPLADTWTWDGSNWSSLATEHAPHPTVFSSDGGGMAADAVHKNLLLVSWPTVSDKSTVETWTLHDGDWVQLHPAHPPAQGEFSGPAYDSVSRRVILQQQATHIFDATYWWDGSDWHVFDLSVRTPHSYGRLVAVGSHGLLLIWAGMVYDWDGKSWSGPSQQPVSLSSADRPRMGWTAAYHEPTNRLILFGGRENAGGPDLRGDTVAFDGSAWKIVSTPPPSPSMRLAECVLDQIVAGMGGDPVMDDPSGAVVEVEFGEPPSGPCHLHVDVVMTVFLGNDLVKMPGNPATQTVDFDLVPGGDRIAAVFDVHGVCALGGGVNARFGGIGIAPEWSLTGYSGCVQPSPAPLGITTSLRHLRV
jgi:hypothetical protein